MNNYSFWNHTCLNHSNETHATLLQSLIGFVCLFVYISESVTTKRMLTLKLPCTGFQFHKEHACLSSPPAPPLPRFDRNQFRAGRLTRLRYKSTHVQPDAPVRTRSYCWIKVADSQGWTHIENPTRLNLNDPDWDYMIFLGNNSPGK